MPQNWNIAAIVPASTSPATDIPKLTDALLALQSNFSGSTLPTTNLVAAQIGADLPNKVFWKRDAANAKWMLHAPMDSVLVVPKTAAYTALLSDFAKTLVCTNSWTLGFTAAATLTDGWYCEVRNAGTGVITLDPNASETEDGALTIQLAPGESCIIKCDGTQFIDVGRTSSALQSLMAVVTTGGTSTAYTLAPVPALTSLSATQPFPVEFHTASGLNPTLAVSGLTPTNLKQYNSLGTKIAAVTATGQISSIQYDGTDYVILDPLPSSSLASVGIRQTVLAGALTAGAPSALSAGSGLAINLSATATNLVLSAAKGFGTNGAVDQIEVLNADAAGVVTLPPYQLSFIYRDLASAWGYTQAPKQEGYSFNQAAQSCLSLNNVSTDDFGNTWTNNAVTFTNASPLIAGTYMGVFNGTTSYMRTTAITSLGNGGWTIRCNFKCSSVSTAQGIFALGLGTGYGIQMYMSGSKLSLYLSSTGSSWDIASAVAGNTTLVNGTSYDVELTYDPVAGKYFVYLNGVAEALLTITSSSKVCGFSNVSVGCLSNTVATAFFIGNIQAFEIKPYCAHPAGTTFTPQTTLADVTAAGYASDFYSIPQAKMFGITAKSTSAGVDPTFTAKTRVYGWEAITGASTVTSVTNYAYQRKYRSSVTAGLPAAAVTTNFNHNLGTTVMDLPRIYAVCLTAEGGYLPGEITEPLPNE